jgi:hypothetical protein
VDTAQFEVSEDIRQSNAYGNYIEDIGWRVVKTPETGVAIFLRKLGPMKIAKAQRFKKMPTVHELISVLEKNRVFMCKLEPSEKFDKVGLEQATKLGFRIDKWPLLGTKTLRVDLRGDTEDIEASFKKDARYCIRQAQKEVETVVFGQADLFYSIWKRAGKNKGLWIPPLSEYKSLISRFDKNCLITTIGESSGCLVLLHKGTAFYYYSAALPEAKKKQLPYLTVWESMKAAKKRGCVVWDFEGIYDPRWPNKGWLGFTHFKKSFGGLEIEYPGSYSKWRWPF